VAPCWNLAMGVAEGATAGREAYSVARLMDRCARCCAGQEHPRFFASTKPMVMRVSTMFASSSRATMRIGLVMAGA
jgi:hypothetical protein